MFAVFYGLVGHANRDSLSNISQVRTIYIYIYVATSEVWILCCA